MTEEESFSFSIIVIDSRLIGFEVNARSSRLKRWGFFGLLAYMVIMVTLAELAPKLEPLLR